MPAWNKVLDEVNESGHALDVVRKKYIKQLHKHTGRNVIAYYSAWLSRDPRMPGLAVTDEDKNALMAVVHKLDRSKGVDLFLHTPGGDMAAAESIVDYLHTMFNGDIRAVVPQLAMSAGTMIACSCKSILMGKQSSLGPIDPKIFGFSAKALLDEFQKAKDEIQASQGNVGVVAAWQAVLSKYNPSLLIECEKARLWAASVVADWLSRGMCSGENNPQNSAQAIVTALTQIGEEYGHGRHVSAESCRGIGLNIEMIEDDPKLQDLILTVHHCYMHVFAHAPLCMKVVENNLGVKWVQQIQQPPAAQ